MGLGDRKKKPHEKLRHKVQFRLTVEEHEAMLKHTSQEGLSAWCREVIWRELKAPSIRDPMHRIILEEWELPRRERPLLSACLNFCVDDALYLELLKKIAPKYTLSEWIRAVTTARMAFEKEERESLGPAPPK